MLLTAPMLDLLVALVLGLTGAGGALVGMLAGRKLAPRITGPRMHQAFCGGDARGSRRAGIAISGIRHLNNG